jgi:hypothetical protein
MQRMNVLETALQPRQRGFALYISTTKRQLPISPDRAAINCFKNLSTALTQPHVSGVRCIHVSASTMKRAWRSVQSASVPNRVTSGMPHLVIISYLVRLWER